MGSHYVAFFTTRQLESVAEEEDLLKTRSSAFYGSLTDVGVNVT